MDCNGLCLAASALPFNAYILYIHIYIYVCMPLGTYMCKCSLQVCGSQDSQDGAERWSGCCTTLKRLQLTPHRCSFVPRVLSFSRSRVSLNSLELLGKCTHCLHNQAILSFCFITQKEIYFLNHFYHLKVNWYFEVSSCFKLSFSPVRSTAATRPSQLLLLFPFLIKYNIFIHS